MGGLAQKSKTAKVTTQNVAISSVRTNSKALKVPIAVKAPVKQKTFKSEEKREPMKRVTVSLKKAPEPRNTRIKITNNTANTKVSVAPTPVVTVKKRAKKESAMLPSKTVLPKPAILSPFRFPMVPSMSALVLVARVVGIFFVASGSILALLNLPALNFVATPASVTDGITNTTTNSTNTTSGTSGSIDTTPDVQVSVGKSTPLFGSVPVTIIVPGATSVKLVLDNRITNQLMTLGMASKIDDMTWTYTWQTTAYENGEYHLRVLIKNQYGDYESADSTVYEIKNVSGTSANTTSGTVSSTTQSTSTQTGTQDTRTETTTNTHPDIDFDIDTASASSTITFTTITEGAQKVGVRATNVKTGTLYSIGTSNLKDGKWITTWNPKMIPNGTYLFFANVTYDGYSAESDHVRAVIENQMTNTVPTNTSTGTTDVPSEALVQPTVSLAVHEGEELSGFAHLTITTSPVLWVELYAVPYKTLTPRFLGIASKQSDTAWTYTWDTTQTPNGSYTVYARVKTVYGFTEGTRTYITIDNPVMSAYTEEEEKTIETLTTVAESLNSVTDNVEEAENLSQDETATVVYIESTDTFAERIASDDSTLKETVEDIVQTYRDQLGVLLEELAKARRIDDEENVRAIRAKIENLMQEVITNLPNRIETKELIDQINTYLSQITLGLTEVTLNNEDIVKKRIGDVVFTDTDKDGISDYDEVHLYKTNPFAADTDGDGVIDGTEIEKGYNALDVTREALVVYESPKDTGVVREDILSINTLMSLSRDSLDEPLRAFISGTALPNSFVTLYFFSSPVIVTVKAGADGSWSYILDKELENGSHEVYIGLTDNTGTIVAKSNPFTFAKTAEAYTAVDAAGAAALSEESKPQFFDTRIFLLIASLLIVLLGLVLLLLGMHAQKVPARTDMLPQPV